MKLIEINEIKEESYLGDVIDIHVEDDNSYNINGIVVHNSGCITRVKTGVGVPQISLIDEIKKSINNEISIEESNNRKYLYNLKKVLICSDGGCTVEGDVVKAFCAGADFVMLGGMLAGHKESPGQIEEINGIKTKRFSGMAAKESQWNGVAEHGTEEGRTVNIPYRGKIYHTINNIEGGIRSACTYTNSHNIKELINAQLILTNEQENKVYVSK